MLTPVHEQEEEAHSLPFCLVLTFSQCVTPTGTSAECYTEQDLALHSHTHTQPLAPASAKPWTQHFFLESREVNSTNQTVPLAAKRGLLQLH